MADVQVTFGANIGELISATKQGASAVSDLADQVKSRFDGIRDTVAAAAAAFGVGLGADAIKSWIAGEAALGEQIEQAAAKLGTTAQQASQLSGIATLTGTAFDTLQTEMERFNLNLGSAGDSTSRVAQGLKALGLNAREFVGVPIPQQLELLAEASARFADGGNKTAAVMAILGRSGAEMIPYLDQGREGIERLQEGLARTGSVMSNDMAASFAKTDQDIHEMGLAWQGLSNKIFDVLNPAIDGAIQKFTQLVESVKEDQIRSAVQALVTDVGGFAVSFVQSCDSAIAAWRELQLILSMKGSDVAENIKNEFLRAARSVGEGFGATYDKLSAQIAQSEAQHGIGAQLDAIEAQTKAANDRFAEQVAQHTKLVEELFNPPTAESGTADAISRLKSAMGDGAEATKPWSDSLHNLGYQAGGAALNIQKLQAAFAAVGKPQAGTMQIGGDKDAQEALDAQITALNTEIAHYKEVEQQKQALIESEVKTKTMSAQQGREAVESALQTELQSSMAVYKQEESLLAGQPQKLAEVLKEEQALQDQYAAAVQKIQIQAAEQSAEAWQKVFQEINSAFDSQISGLLKGTTTWQKAFQNVLSSLLTDTIKFFVNAGLQETEYVALQLAGQKAVTMGAEAAAAQQFLANAGKVAQSLITDAKQVFGAVFAFLSPELGPAAAVPAAAAAGTVAAGSYAIGSWELPADMIAQVHKGEMIVPAERTPWAQNLMANAMGAGTGDVHHHHHNWNVSVNGAQDPSAVADALESQVKRIGKAFARATGTRMPRFT